MQIYRSDMAKSISSERKLMPMWSEPHRITERLLNSYKLETLDGQALDGEYHARRLRGFVPREGTELATQQEEFEAGRVDDTVGEETEVDAVDNGDEGTLERNAGEDTGESCSL